MNQKKNLEMDRKKSKRRKNSTGKRHGRAEENPKSAEVMNEKEKQDRLEAANALSSLMFFPPKGSSETNEEADDPVTPSGSVTQFSLQQTTCGIPPTSQTSSLVHNAGGVSTGSSAAVQKNVNWQNNTLILSQLQSQLSQALKTNSNQLKMVNIIPLSMPQTAGSVGQSAKVLPGKLKNTSNTLPNVPFTVHPQNLTVNKNVAKALRQVVSNNKQKTDSQNGDNLIKRSNSFENNEDGLQSVDLSHRYSAETEGATLSRTSPTEDQERMECDSLPSMRKAGNADTKLPLKKRRLIGVTDEIPALTTANLTLTSADLPSNLGTLNTTRNIENILNIAKDYPASPLKSMSSLNLITAVSQTDEGYKPVHFDPRTSLMVLSDLKFALTPDEDGDLPIHIAVVHENTELVKRFIDIMANSGKTVDRFNKLQQTPLHLAVLVNKPEIIALLLEAGANPNLLDRHGYTSVHIAVNKQLPDCMDAVFRHSQHRVNLNTRDYEGYYPLHTCVEVNEIEMMMVLVQQGADKDCQDGKAGRSVLLYAIEYNREPIVDFLLAQGAHPELRNYAGITPMMTAQAANLDTVIQSLNRVLDIGYKYEESYIPSKKVFNGSSFKVEEQPVTSKLPMAKIPSKSAQVITRDGSCSKRYVNHERPLIFEEFKSEELEYDVNKIKREPLSRQSSESSPMDLSMKSNPGSPRPPPKPELPTRGRPRKRKGEKEPRYQKEKHAQKSLLKEKHASVVEALNRKVTLGKQFRTKIKDSSEVTENNTDCVSVKVEEESKSEEKQANIENDAPTKSPLPTTTTLKQLVDSVGIQQATLFLEKLKEQFLSNNFRRNIATNNPNNTVSTTQGNRVETKQLTNAEKMQIDSETATDVHKNSCQTESESEKHVESVKSDNVIMSEENKQDLIDSSMKEGNEEVEKATNEVVENEINENLKDNESLSSSLSSENGDAMEHENDNVKDIKSVEAENDNSENTKPQTPDHVESSIESAKNEYSEMETEQNSAENISDADTLKVQRNKPVGTTSNKNDSHAEQQANELSSQMSLDSNSGSSSKGSQGFEIAPAAVNSEITSPSVVNVSENSNEKYSVDDRDSDHSDSSMEIEFSVDTLKSQNIAIPESLDIDDQKSESSIENRTIPKSLTIEAEELQSEDESERTDHLRNESSKAETDEDDYDNSLVIDENNSEDEAVVQDEKVQTNNKINDEKEDNEKTDTNESITENESSSVDNAAEENNEEGKDCVSGENLESVDDHKLAQDTDPKSAESDRTIGTEQKTEEQPDNKVSESNEKTTESVKESGKPLSVETFKEPAPAASLKDNLKSIGPDQLPSNVDSSSLKKGQAHTLYYHDGDSYKPVKIFIDNSEQSSLVLQRMFQTAQFSNLKKQSGVTPATSSLVEAKPQTVPKATSSDNVASLKVVDSTPKVGMALPVQSGKSLSSQSDKVSVSGEATINKPVSFVNKTVGKLPVVSISSVLPKPTESKSYLASFQHAYVKSLKNTNQATEKVLINNSNEQGKKPIPALKRSVSISKAEDVKTVQKSQSEQKPKTLDASSLSSENVQFVLNRHLNIVKAKSVPEGTLTRVNPDIRNKLSKALQSPQRKVVLSRTDSDVCVVNNKAGLENSLGSLPSTATSITESRQQS